MFHPQGPSFFELAQQALSSTERGYDLLAPKFDVTPFRTPDAVLQPVHDYLKRGPGIRGALDLCCGTGAVMRALLPVVTDELVGVDFSEGMLSEARRRLSPLPLQPSVRFERRDVLALPAEGAFDLATCFGALGHVPYGMERAFLRSVGGVLRPSGRFVFVSAAKPPPWSRSYWFGRGFNAVMHARNALLRPSFVMFYLRFLVPEATAWLNAAGFSVRLVGGLFPAPYERYVLVDATKER